jgi:hypothetical protein
MRARSCAREWLAEAPVGSRDAEARDARVFRAVLRKRCLPQLERIRELAERYPGNADVLRRNTGISYPREFWSSIKVTGPM